MRVVLLGKGGSGKSTLAGLLATALAAGGDAVLALDADSVPGLAQVLGLEETDDWFLAGAAVREHGGWRLTDTAEATVARCARPAPGGVRFIQVGNADAAMKDFQTTRRLFPDRWSSQMAFHTLSRSYDEEGGWVIVDLHGGTLQVAGGAAGQHGVAVAVVEPFAKSVLTARRFVEMGEWPPGLRLVAVASKVGSAEDEAWLSAELAALGVPLWAVVVVEPYPRSAEVGRRLLRTAEANGITRCIVVANKIADQEDLDALRRFLGVDPDLVIPADRAVVAADRVGTSPIDHDPASPAVGVIRDLASALVA